MAKPITVGELAFPTRKAATKYFKAILWKYKPGRALDFQDNLEVIELLKLHYLFDQIRGAGGKYIYVDNDEKGGQCFHVKRVDGTSENFSYHKCIDGEPPAFTKFSNACRLAVEADLLVYKQKFFDNEEHICQSTKEPIEWATADVDHVKRTFSELVDRFVDKYDIDLTKTEYETVGTYGSPLKDPLLAESFRRYHKEFALLRVVSKAHNSSKSAQGRLKPCGKDGKL